MLYIFASIFFLCSHSNHTPNVHEILLVHTVYGVSSFGSGARCSSHHPWQWCTHHTPSEAVLTTRGCDINAEM